MLILARRVGESIVLDECIRITVKSIGKSRVRLAIDIPDEVHCRRGELDPEDRKDDRHDS